MDWDRAPTNKAQSMKLNLRRKHAGELNQNIGDLYDDRSQAQKYVAQLKPRMPSSLTKFVQGLSCFVPEDFPELQKSRVDAEAVDAAHPNIRDVKYATLKEEPAKIIENRANWLIDRSKFANDWYGARRVRGDEINVGVILSGGPAPGGHNVICGIYQFLNEMNPDSSLIGYMGGLDGFFQRRSKTIDKADVDRYLNTGGFDMLWSGRGRFKNDDHMDQAVRIMKEDRLHALIIIGGDGSNSNAAKFAEHVARKGHSLVIVGVPKTIDGDLKGPAIECSFGFDTCAKTYSELIGNLCTDILSSQESYHVVRVMGRAASHLVLECALQTRPNIVFIGEQVRKEGRSLKSIVAECCDLIMNRGKAGKRHGIILLPEGLIEFIPEINHLILVLNKLLHDNPDVDVCDDSCFDHDQKAKDTWLQFPEQFRFQLAMEREASGYVQVAKIQTERLLISMIRKELGHRMFDDDGLVLMPHYFGYEGRCAIPSLFDQSYCYSLGATAAAIIMQGLNGCMAVVRRLSRPTSEWIPAACPLTSLMVQKLDQDGNVFYGVHQKLVSLDDPLFRVLESVRELWCTEDVYRVPGPIQFDGPTATLANYTVACPRARELLWGNNAAKLGRHRWVCPKRPGQLSSLQRDRINYSPPHSKLLNCTHVAVEETQTYPPRDPYTARQVQIFYPHLQKHCQYKCYSIVERQGPLPGTPGGIPRAISNSSLVGSGRLRTGQGKRTGLLFLSRQSPGMMNVLMGLFDRTQITGGQVIGFYGMDGLLEGKGLEVEEKDLDIFINSGGCELLGRSGRHALLYAENHERVTKTVAKLALDAIVIVGTNLALTEAAMVNEYFLENLVQCQVIGVPASGSNNLRHELLEQNLGFDTTSKIYANLIGNVLSDAASMPKYWHFIRLLGRTPSCEVLECALQTHPNFVVISEAYGAAQKSLEDVVNDIADLVERRAQLGKNFGTVILPDALLGHLMNMKKTLNAVEKAQKASALNGGLIQVKNEMVRMQGPAWEGLDGVSQERLSAMPLNCRAMLVQYSGRDEGGNVELERLLAEMVGEELKRRPTYKGVYQTVSHFFGYQGRSAIPSNFDANLGYSLGLAAGILIESGLTGHIVSMRGLCGHPNTWKATTIPFTAMFAIVPAQQDVHHELHAARVRKGGSTWLTSDVPVIPANEVSLDSKAYRWMKTALAAEWMLNDKYCNPGPIQFHNVVARSITRTLYQEQYEYWQMLMKVRNYTDIVKSSCNFGVDSEFLRAAFLNMQNLILLRFFKDDMTNIIPDVTDKLELGEMRELNRIEDEDKL